MAAINSFDCPRGFSDRSKCTRPEGRCELSTDTEDSLLCLAFRVCSFGSGAFAGSFLERRKRCQQRSVT